MGRRDQGGRRDGSGGKLIARLKWEIEWGVHKEFTEDPAVVAVFGAPPLEPEIHIWWEHIYHAWKWLDQWRGVSMFGDQLPISYAEIREYFGRSGRAPDPDLIEEVSLTISITDNEVLAERAKKRASATKTPEPPKEF